MTKKYEIVLKYIKDLSVEIPNAEAFIFSRENITKYSLGINITSNQIKDEMVEVVTKVNYKDPKDNQTNLELYIMKQDFLRKIHIEDYFNLEPKNS